MRIGVLGGSFDPPHIGHIMLAVWALVKNDMDRVFIVPCQRHAFGKDLAPYLHRFKMCKIAFSAFKNRITVSNIEKGFGGANRSYITLSSLKKKHKNRHFTLIIGSDILKELPKWYKADRLLAEFGIAVVPRGRQKERTLYIPDIRSSSIRKLIKKGTDISAFVPQGVGEYIKKHGLYKS